MTIGASRPRPNRARRPVFADLGITEQSADPRLDFAPMGTVALTDRVSSGELVEVNRHSPVESASFDGYRFPPDVILLAVRWYLRYGLSYRDVKELLAERGCGCRKFGRAV